MCPRELLYTAVFMVGFGLSLLLFSCPARSAENAPGRNGPVLSHRITENSAEKLAQQLQVIMAMSEQEVLDLVPPQTPISHCGCPNCEIGAFEGMNDMLWSPEKPHQMTCKHCSHVYPDPAMYPMSHTQTVTTPTGEEFTAHYYLDEQGRDYFIHSKIWELQREWLVAQAYELAKAYHVTNEPAYARRAALIIDGFARVFPHWCVVKQYTGRRRQYTSLPYSYEPDAEPPYPTVDGGRWGKKWISEIPHTLVAAYDLICDSRAVDNLCEDLSTDVRGRIQRDLFRPTVEYTQSFPIRFRADNRPNWVAHTIRLGRVIGEPEYVHFGYNWVRDILQSRHLGQYHRDGMFCQSPSYHSQMTGRIGQVMSALRNYSDPADYAATDGLRLENVNIVEEIPFYTRARTAMHSITYPGNNTPPIGDSFRGHGTISADEISNCHLLPSWGHAVLGTGRGTRQIQAHLRLGAEIGHGHADALNLALFAYGREMLCDLGYHKNTGMRFWTASTIGHNLVAIDRREQRRSDRSHDANLLLYTPNLPGFAVIEASAESAYPGLAEIYRRMLILVSNDRRQPYLVDVFHVRGGSKHDWLLHGDADEPQAVSSSLALSSLKKNRPLLEMGDDWIEPDDSDIWNYDRWPSFADSVRPAVLKPYGLMQNVRSAVCEDTWQATFAYTDRPDVGVRIHMLGGPVTRLFVGQTPGLRRTETLPLQPSHYMPQILARRVGDSPLESVFVAVIAPFGGGPRIRSIHGLETHSPDNTTIALQINTGHRTDTLLVALPPASGVQTGEGTVLKGRVGLVSETNGRLNAAYLVGGDELSKDRLRLTAPPTAYSGTIEATMREDEGAETNAFITPAQRPPGIKLRGEWMIVTNGENYTQAHRIARVSTKNGKTVLHTQDDHGLRITDGSVEEMYYPCRSFPDGLPWWFTVYQTAMTRGGE